MEGLRNELDFANTAASELNVLTFFQTLQGTFLRRETNLCVQVGKRTDRPEIQVLPINERADNIVDVFLLDIEVFLRSKHRAVNDTALEPCKALPVASLRHQVLFEHVA